MEGGASYGWGCERRRETPHVNFSKKKKM